MSTLERPDATLFYTADGAGSPLLLTHGYAATSRMWRGQAGTFRDRHQVVTWDLRGHGRSSSPDDPSCYSREASVADMAALLDALGHEQAIVGGLSLGGYLSLAFHLAHPERVRALVIIDTGPGYKREAPREEWNEMARGLADRLDQRGLEHLAKLSTEMDPSEHRSAAGLARAARGMLTQHDRSVIDSLPDIRVPTLVIVGEKDRAYRGPSDYMAAKIPGAQLAVIENAGHAVNLHQPERFDEVLGAFLERLA